MSYWSRRDVLRASAGAAAVAVPMAALSGGAAGASSTPGVESASGPEALSPEEIEAYAEGSVMFFVQDPARGEVAILHGENEVIVRDPQLVARVLRAANINGRVR